MERDAHRGHQSGYTLLEVVIVCGIIGLMAALAVPTYSITTDAIRLRDAAAVLAADIRLVQAQAQHEGKRARLSLDVASDAYDLQIASTQTAGDTCQSPDYETFRRVQLGAQFQAKVTSATFQCLVFEPTGRTAWPSPLVLKTQTTAADTGTKSWTQYLNGATTGWDVGVTDDPQANTWTDQSEVTVTLDLGAVRTPGTVCPDILEDLVPVGINPIDFPTSVRLDWSSVTGATPPNATQWQSLGTLTAPYSSVIQSPSGLEWRRTCPAFQLTQPMRYIRFVFAPSTNRDGLLIMALDEIKIDAPDVTIQNQSGRNSRTITVTPITGRVQIQ